VRVNLINMLRQSARAIDPDRDHGAYAFMLEEVADHLNDVRDGKHTWDEFAEFYCLTERYRSAESGAS